MNFSITFETDAAHFWQTVGVLQDRLSPDGVGDFLEDVVEPFVKARIDQRFDAEGDDVTGKWHPLTVATQMIRASKGLPPDHPINVRYGKMRNYLVNSPSDLRITGIDATLIHPQQTGDAELNEKIQTAQQGKKSPLTPPRPVLGFNENDLAFITSELTAWIVRDFI